MQEIKLDANESGSFKQTVTVQRTYARTSSWCSCVFGWTFLAFIWPVIEFVYSAEIDTYCDAAVAETAIDIGIFLIFDALIWFIPVLLVVTFVICLVSLCGCAYCCVLNITVRQPTETDPQQSSPTVDDNQSLSDGSARIQSGSGKRIVSQKIVKTISGCAALVSLTLVVLGGFSAHISMEYCHAPIPGILIATIVFRCFFLLLALFGFQSNTLSIVY